jgi:hypothetical protein
MRLPMEFSTCTEAPPTGDEGYLLLQNPGGPAPSNQPYDCSHAKHSGHAQCDPICVVAMECDGPVQKEGQSSKGGADGAEQRPSPPGPTVLLHSRVLPWPTPATLPACCGIALGRTTRSRTRVGRRSDRSTPRPSSSRSRPRLRMHAPLLHRPCRAPQ